MLPAQSGLLHTWGHLRKKMKRSLQVLLESDSGDSLNLQDLHLATFYHQIGDRGSYIASVLKIKFKTRYDDRLPLVVRGNVTLLRLAVSLMLDYVMDRYSGVGYTTFEIALFEFEEDDQAYINFTVCRAGVASHDDGIRTWFSNKEMEHLASLLRGSFIVEDQFTADPRYTVRIPLILGDQSKTAQISPAVLCTRLTLAPKGITALVVDDSFISRILGVYLLSRHNITADVAEDGRMAVKKCADRYYDLIFMDYSMPILNGIQTTALIRDHERELRHSSVIIGMSNCADSAENMEAAFREAGMQGYLSKPVEPLELNLLLQDLLPHLHMQSATATEQKDAPEHTDSAQENLLSTLSGIAELDAAKGLANVGGSVEIYASMLRRFSAELMDYIEPLLTLASDASWEEVVPRLHVLREFFFSIGAENLAREAALLAASVETEGGGKYMSRIQSHCDAMMRLRAKLVNLKAENSWERGAEWDERERGQTERTGVATLGEQVLRLHNACLSYRATEAQKIVENLRKMTLCKDMEDQIERICVLVDALDYQEARERCLHLLKAIEPHA